MKIACFRFMLYSSKQKTQLNHLNKTPVMSKRTTEDTKRKKTSPHKTKKRLEVKRLMLEAKANKKKHK